MNPKFKFDLIKWERQLREKKNGCLVRLFGPKNVAAVAVAAAAAAA